MAGDHWVKTGDMAEIDEEERGSAGEKIKTDLPLASELLKASIISEAGLELLGHAFQPPWHSLYVST